MSISKVKYRNTFFPKLDLTRILGIPTYNTLHQMQLDLEPTIFVFAQTLGVTLTDILDFWWWTPYSTNTKQYHTRCIARA